MNLEEKLKKQQYKEICSSTVDSLICPWMDI